MIIINKNNTNNVILTCSELMVDTNNYVAIRFVNDVTFEEVFALLKTNISPSIGRYDEFEITETTPNLIDPEEGIINLSKPGQWTYTCYEWPIADVWNPNTVTSKRQIETGRALVKGEVTDKDEVYQ